MIEEISVMVLERDKLIDDRREDTSGDDERIDALREEIYEALKVHHSTLPVEFIIESLTSLGSAPSILYDDNGHFTIGGDGTQNLPTVEDGFETKETTFNGCWFVKPGGWKRTIREAIKGYFEDRE